LPQSHQARGLVEAEKQLKIDNIGKYEGEGKKGGKGRGYQNKCTDSIGCFHTKNV
jgi:hypothetical protein